MKATWLRSVFGVIAGAANLFANGTNWKQVAVSSAITGIGVVSHLTSNSNQATMTAVNPASQRTTSNTERF
jgi:hypothetical protein